MIMKDASDLLKRVNTALDVVRPHLAVDGGNIEIVEITDDMQLHVRWLGACSNCSMSMMTMRAGVEEAVLGRVPEIKGIHAVNGTFPSAAVIAPDNPAEEV